MKKANLVAAVAASIVLSAGSSQALTLVEEFNDPFPDWESGWLASNSSIQNYYGVGAGRGNQPYGLWVQDSFSDSVVDVVFDPVFGALWTDFSMDVATFVSNNVLTIYDVNGATLGEFSNFYTSSYSDAETVAVVSANGIGGFRFSSVSTQGNTWIDNVTVSDGGSSTPAPVPLPAGFPLLVAALAAMGVTFRKTKDA